MDTDRTGVVDNDGTWASPTAPGLLVGRFVVDSGAVKEMSFDPHSRLEALLPCWVSRTSSSRRTRASRAAG